MRIAIDYRILTLLPAWRTRGIPRYTQQQLREVLRIDRDNEYVVLTPAAYQPEQILPEIRSAPNVSLRPFTWSEAAGGQVVAPAPALTLRRTEEFQTWLMRERIDVFHSPTPWFQTETIFPGIDVCATVTAVYDGIPLLFPEEFGFADAFWRRLYGTLPWSTRLLAISEATRADIVRLLSIPASRIDVAYPVADPAYRRLPHEDVQRRLAPLRSQGISDSFLLTVTFVGGATKNIELLLHAYAGLPPSVRQAYPLVVVGHFGEPGDARVRALMASLGVSETVIVLGVIPDETLAALYNAATLVVIPSRYEGFGMPLLEAMQCGAPVLASTSSSMPEVVGDAGALVAPDEPAGFTQAIADIVGSRVRQEEMREAGFVRARRFSPEQLGRATLESYARAMRDRSARAEGPGEADGSPRILTAPTRRRVAIWADLPPAAGHAARCGRTLVDSLSAHAELELFVGEEDLPAPELTSRYRVHVHTAFDRRHAQAPFDAVIVEPGAERLIAAARALPDRHPGLPVFGISPGLPDVVPSVPDPMGVRSELEHELTRTSLGIRPGTFAVALACGSQNPDSTGLPPHVGTALDAVEALTQRIIDVQIVIALDGARHTRQMLEAAVVRRGLRRHTIWVEPRAIERSDEHLLACDAAVVPVEPGGRTHAALSALAAGLPVLIIGDSSPRIPESACISLPADAASAAVSDELLALATDPGRRRQLARDARACYERQFSPAVMAQAYCSAIDARRRGGRAPDAPQNPAVGSANPQAPALRFNKACEIEDFSHPDLGPFLHDDLGHPPRLDRAVVPPWDRKRWEVAMAVRTLTAFGAVHAQAAILGVAAGMEDTIYQLASKVREMTVVDRYLQPGEWDSFASPWMALSPELGLRTPPGKAPDPVAAHVRGAHMDARWLRFADGTFDGIFSSGSIEHVGGLDDIAHAAYEMGRVLKPGGVLSISTELLLRGPAEPHVFISGNMILLRHEQIRRYIVEASGCELVDDLVTEISAATRGTRQAIGHAFAVHGEQTAAWGVRASGWSDRLWTRPYLVLEHDGCLFGSVHIALRKRSTYPSPPNAWARPGARVLEALVVDRRELVAALGGWGPGTAPAAGVRGVNGRLAAAAAKVAARANERQVACHALRDAMARVISEADRVERELTTIESEQVERELASLREEVRRLSARTAEIERHAVGWRMLMRGLVAVLTPSPGPVVKAPVRGVRAQALRVGRRFKPLARRLPRLAHALRRWIYAN